MCKVNKCLEPFVYPGCGGSKVLVCRKPNNYPFEPIFPAKLSKSKSV